MLPDLLPWVLCSQAVRPASVWIPSEHGGLGYRGAGLTYGISSAARTQVLASTVALLCFGMLGAGLGGASLARGGVRVVIGGWLAMGITYGFGRAFGIAGGML